MRNLMARVAWPAFPEVVLDEKAQSRDLALDVVRSWSLLVVVFGHFIMQILIWRDGIPAGGNTLSSGGPWPFVTWVLQVMPLFFIAGGAVNAGSYQRFGGGYQLWLWQRVKRLMQPTVIYLCVMALSFTFISAVFPLEIVKPLVVGVTGPLWFLSVYIAVVALTPVSIKFWERFGASSIFQLLALVAVFDFLRLQVSASLGLFNLVIAWVLVHQLGFWYREGVRKDFAKGFIAFGLAGNVILTQILGWYPTSLVGIPTEAFSNMAPPTIILALHSLVLFGSFVLLAPKLQVWANRPKPFVATARAGMTAMTIYLWHMSFLVLWLSLLHAFDADLPVRIEKGVIVPDGLLYWVWLIPSTVGFGLFLYLAVRYLWPLEYIRIPWFEKVGNHSESSTPSVIAGTLIVSLSVLAIAGAGFAGFPWEFSENYGLRISTPIALGSLLVGLVILKPRKLD